MHKSEPHNRLIRFDELKNGSMRRIVHNGKAYLLSRVEDTVYVTDDLCTHEDVSLSLGALRDFCLRCPLHGSEFDIRTGQVLGEPADVDLKTYPVTLEDNWVCLA